MPAFVTPRRGPESRGRSLVNVSAQSDATHPGETPDPGEAWPLPKRLRVRLQTSAERFGKETALDERLRLAERLQVRASTAERVSRVSRGFVSRQKGVSLFAPGRQGGPGERDARAHHDRVPALEATLRPNACLRFARPGYPPTRAACEPADLPRHNLFDSFKSPSNEKSTTTLNRERFRVSCDDAMHEKKKQKSTRRRQTDADASRGTRD